MKFFYVGKNHSNESKIKMSESAKNRKVNSRSGTCWIYNLELEENKKIKKGDLNIYLKSGWIRGIKRKFHKKIKKLNQ